MHIVSIRIPTLINSSPSMPNMTQAHPLSPEFGGAFTSVDCEREVQQNPWLVQLYSLNTSDDTLFHLLLLVAKELLETRAFARGWHLASYAVQGRLGEIKKSSTDATHPTSNADGNQSQISTNLPANQFLPAAYNQEAHLSRTPGTGPAVLPNSSPHMYNVPRNNNIMAAHPPRKSPIHNQLPARGSRTYGNQRSITLIDVTGGVMNGPSSQLDLNTHAQTQSSRGYHPAHSSVQIRGVDTSGGHHLVGPNLNAHQTKTKDQGTHAGGGFRSVDLNPNPSTYRAGSQVRGMYAGGGYRQPNPNAHQVNTQRQDSSVGPYLNAHRVSSQMPGANFDRGRHQDSHVRGDERVQLEDVIVGRSGGVGCSQVSPMDGSADSKTGTETVRQPDAEEL